MTSFQEDCVNSSARVLSCPICSEHFHHDQDSEHISAAVFGYGLDFRLVPRDCNRASDVATCPSCFFTSRVQDFEARVSGNVKDLVRSRNYVRIFADHPAEGPGAGSWVGLVSVLEVRGLNPRDLGLMSLRGSWVARELGDPKTEEKLLEKADAYLDDALRRGLTKADPGLIMYLLGEINRRRGQFLRGREMLTFLGNNPRYRYPALLLTVLIEEEDSTPYWSHHAPDQMEQHSPRFKGLFPPLRSIPPRKTDFSPDELREQSEKPD